MLPCYIFFFFYFVSFFFIFLLLLFNCHDTQQSNTFKMFAILEQYQFYMLLRSFNRQMQKHVVER